jgi:hypothetical protein
MRYKQRPEHKRDLGPVRLDVTDLEYIIGLAGDGAEMEIETKRCEYDGPDDLIKHLHWRAKLTKLRINYGELDYIDIVDSWRVIGKRATAAAPPIEKFLRDNRRRRVKMRVAIVWLVVAYAFAVAPPVSHFLGAREFDAAIFNPFWNLGWLFSSSGMGFSISMLTVLFTPSVIVPTRRDGSWLRQHMPTLIVGLACTIIGAVITALIT